MELQWSLILFTSLLAWSAGLFATQCVLALKGEALKTQMPAWIASAILLVAGGIAVFTHLQHWERIFNGFGHLTSGITQELICIVILAAVAVVYFVYLRKNEGRVPMWIAVLGIVAALVLVIVMGMSYMMAARPAWNNVLEVASLLGNALVMGPATMLIIKDFVSAEEKTPVANIAAVIGAAVNVVTTVGFVGSMSAVGDAITNLGYSFDLTTPTAPMIDPSLIGVFSSDSIAFTVCAIVGALAALVCAIVGKCKGGWKIWGLVAIVAGLIGAICLRTLFYQMGVALFIMV